MHRLTDLFFAVGLEQHQRRVSTVRSSLPPRSVTLKQMYLFAISQDSPVLGKALPGRLTALVADDMQAASEAKAIIDHARVALALSDVSLVSMAETPIFVRRDWRAPEHQSADIACSCFAELRKNRCNNPWAPRESNTAHLFWQEHVPIVAFTALQVLKNQVSYHPA